MKSIYNNKIKILLLIIFNLIINLNLLIAQGKITNSVKDKFITKLDASQIAESHFPNSQLIRKTAKWNCGREYVYKLNNNANIFITVGLHQSYTSVYDVANQYLNDISIRMVEGLEQVKIGDKFWWWATNNDTNVITNIVFIRKNALFILSSQNYNGLLNLAKLIDEDISNKEKYILMEEVIRIPIIHSMTKEVEELKQDKNTKFKIDAVDINNETLEYQFSPGLTKFKNDPKNVFTYIDTNHKLEKYPVKQKIKVVAINENNVVSEIAEFDLEFD